LRQSGIINKDTLMQAIN
jgi:hypothetical protein